MYEELSPIRKVVENTTLNTDTAHLHGSNEKVVSERIRDEVTHRYMRQSLYQVPDGPYFLAFWNKPRWDEAAMQLVYTDDADIIEPDQAELWMRTYCPSAFDAFERSRRSEGATASTVAVNLRMPVALRAALQRPGTSFNKVCINLINVGLRFLDTNHRVSRPPSWAPLRMPNGEPAVDELSFAARAFDDPEDQALANYAERFYWLAQQNDPAFLPTALGSLFRLFHINHDKERAMCVAIWLSHFYRASEAEYAKPTSGPRETGRWVWQKDETQLAIPTFRSRHTQR